MNQSREAHLSAWPLHSPEGGHKPKAKGRSLTRSQVQPLNYQIEIW